MLKKLDELENLIVNRRSIRKLILAAAQDTCALGAVFQAREKNIIKPILVGDKVEIINICKANNYDLKGLEIIHEPDRDKSVKISVRMAREGKADILMKGNISSSVLLKGVLNREYGLRTGELLSHFAIFEVATYHKLIAVTDSAINIAPDLKDKISILQNSIVCMNKLGYLMPKIAVLGAAEIVNVNMEPTIDAAVLSKMNQRNQIKNCIIDGPLAFDNAVNAISAKHKEITSEVAGDTDLLLMPNIDVGNVLYKTLVFFAGASVAAVNLGAAVPVILPSRSDSEKSKFDSILLAAAIC